MIKTKTLLLSLLACGLSSGPAFAQSRELRTLDDSVSYALAVDMAQQLKQMNVPFSIDAFTTGIRDVLDEHPATLSQQACYAILRDYFTVHLPALKKKESEEYLASVLRDQPNVRQTESGLLYQIVAPGDPKRRPDGSTPVRVHYEGRLRSGEVFDSSRERGEPALIPLSNVIDGWAEGVQLIGEGGTIRLWIPPELGYGAQGASPMVGPNEAIFFEIELLEVDPAE